MNDNNANSLRLERELSSFVFAYIKNSTVTSILTIFDVEEII
jgi:hypothetical protein